MSGSIPAPRVTLRYVIDQADQVTNNNSTITFGGVGSPILLAENELDISQNMTIVGPGIGNLTINGTDTAAGTTSRVFNISSDTVTVTISGLTITGGNAQPDVDVTKTSGAGDQGGDIINGGTLFLNNDSITGGFSSGQATGPAGEGGGIFNLSGANLVLNNTSVTGNEAIGGTGNDSLGLGAGGGIYNQTAGNVSIEFGSQFIGNLAQGANNFSDIKGESGGAAEGGAVGNQGALTILGSSASPVTFSGNIAKAGTAANGVVGTNGSTPAAGTGEHGNFNTGDPATFDPTAGGTGGNGGSADGGAIFSSPNSGSSTAMVTTVTWATFTSNMALASVGSPSAA